MKVIVLSAVFVLSLLTVLAQQKPEGLPVQTQAPTFVATDQSGKTINLSAELTQHSVVLVFYRGQWCPYCNKALKALDDSLQYIQAKGATVIAVTPEKPESIAKTIEKTNASYAVVYDEGLRIMKSYRVNFAVDSLTITRYKNYGIDFTVANGEANGANLPVPAVYVINKNGKIVYRHFDPDYRKRANISEIIKHL